ncbi:hypothetical protein LTR50_004705 [Elasticomyces elasticus]|nr:hypothetical protein LTR50_004705 [Elasticomyces elasticus]
MSKSAELHALEEWFKANGGYLHPAVHLAEDESHGVHLRASEAVESGTHLITVPHSISLSYLNALVDEREVLCDERETIWKTLSQKLPPEVVGWFYLAHQYVHKQRSFWKPYLDTLPAPETGIGTPFSFDDGDLRWLHGTDLYHSFERRKEVWEGHWKVGIDVIGKAGMATEQFTWDLFVWAATIYTSRSFTSRSIRPVDSKYWAAYRSTRFKSFPGPQRQTVLLELPKDTEDFPVLFPLIDAGNHNPKAEVEWSFDPGRFDMKVLYNIEPDQQIWKNYGPKGNDELLMGYGFCIEGNEDDSILLAPKPPPLPVQVGLQRTHKRFFDRAGVWNPEAATFKLPPLKWTVSSEWVSCMPKAWHAVPDVLVELMWCILRYERSLTVDVDYDATAYFSRGYGARYLPHVAKKIVESLVVKLAKITASEDNLDAPRNRHQENAAIYRESQKWILRGLISDLKGFLHDLRPPQFVTTAQPCIWTIEEALKVWKSESPSHYNAFMAGMKVAANSSKVRTLVAAGWEDDLWALWLCYVKLQYMDEEQHMLDTAGKEKMERSIVRAWVAALHAEYENAELLGDSREALEGNAVDAAAASSGQEQLMSVVRSAAQSISEPTPESLWARLESHSALLGSWGCRIVQSEGMLMDVEGDGQSRWVMYLYVDGPQPQFVEGEPE